MPDNERRMWAYLNEIGIHSPEDLARRIRETPKINLAIFQEAPNDHTGSTARRRTQGR